MNNKPWYEKVGIWIGIIAGLFTILGVSVYNNKSLIKDEDETMKTSEYDNNEGDNEELQSSLTRNESAKQEKIYTPEPTKVSDSKPIETTYPQEPSPTPTPQEPIVSPFVTSSPDADSVIHVDLSNWTDSDRDIFNINYTGTNTMKLSVYNTIFAIGGGADDITAEIHMPLGERFNDIWTINFVAMQDMVGNGSYANITILSGEDKLYDSFLLESDTTEEIIRDVNLSGIRDLIIRFECHAVGSGFCGGIIFTDQED